MKEFNLSEKICGKPVSDINAILVKDVKEFIKKLKEELYNLFPRKDDDKSFKIIDKLAGDKLK